MSVQMLLTPFVIAHVLVGRGSVRNHPTAQALGANRARFITCALVDEAVGMPAPADPSSVGPSADKWNKEVLEQWEHAWLTGREGDYEIDDIEGTIPRSLRGALFRNGPGNFERGGKRFQHVLDGDGLLCRFSIDGERGRAHFRARFVRTPEFEAERKADAVLFRNTFGTQPASLLATVGRLAVKNVANTNVQSWGGRTYALWEAGLPVRVEPLTLDFEGYETFGGAIAGGVASVVTGVERVDRLLGYGEAFTAHPRHDMRRGTVVGWAWAIRPTLDGVLLKIFEFGHENGEVRSMTRASLPTPLPPHDFVVTDSWYVFMLNGMHVHLLPFMLGLGGTAQTLISKGTGVILHLVPRPGGAAEGRRPITLRTRHSIFPLHQANGFDDPVQADGSQRVTLYSTALPDMKPGPLLGDWGGAVPLFDQGRIKPTQLMRTVITVDARGKAETSCEIVMNGACLEHPHVDPRFDGDRRCRYIYSTWSNGMFDGEGWSTSGSPPIGWCRYDSATGEAERWVAPRGCFCEEPVIIPKDGCAEHVHPDAVDEAHTWLVGMMFDSARGVSCLAILDGADLSAGPVCKLWLRQHVPHGLHGCWVEGAPYGGE